MKTDQLTPKHILVNKFHFHPAKIKREQKDKRTKTYNRRDSQMVTHSSTSRPVQCLCMAERTGCPVLTDLWSYVSKLAKTWFVKIRVEWAKKRQEQLAIGVRENACDSSDIMNSEVIAQSLHIS
jgi:hypothetical protein